MKTILAITGAAMITAMPTILYTPSLTDAVAASEPLFLAWMCLLPAGFVLLIASLTGER